MEQMQKDRTKLEKSNRELMDRQDIWEEEIGRLKAEGRDQQ